jgi:hypothetical protein
MKNLINYFIAILFVTILNSCDQKRNIIFEKFDFGNGYSIELPKKYIKINETTWEAGKNSFINISVNQISNTDIKTELSNYLASPKMVKLFENSKLIKTEEFDENGLKGVVFFYKEDIKKQRAGIVSFTSYNVFGIVRDDRNQFKISSMALSDNNFNQISKSIKSISMIEKTLDIPIVKNFNEKKAIEDGYQVFQDDGFMIKCEGKIKLDRLRIQQFKQSGIDNSRPYHVYHNGTDYNINVSSFVGVLSGQTEQEKADFHKSDLDYYQTKFDEMSIKNSRDKFKDFDAVYYENTQNGKTTKAVFFHHQMKSYMLQVTDDKNVEKKFQDFIKTFEIL